MGTELPTPNILFCGDPHGEFRAIREAVAEFRPNAIVLLGDCDLDRPLEEELGAAAKQTDVYWIHGNHDTDRDHWYDNLFHSGLSDGCIHTRVIDIGGVRIAGLGGVFRGQVWHPETGIRVRSRAEWLQQNSPTLRWRGRVPRRHHSSIFWEDYEALANASADILVTHEAPDCHPHGFTEIADLARFVGARLIVHGHHHEDYMATTDDELCIIGVGKQSIRNLANQLVQSPG